MYDENVVLTGKNIVLRSTAPENPAVVAATVISGGGRGSVLTLAGTETAACRIAGLTVRNGAAESGAGINGKEAAATIEHCIVTDNRATFGAGGIDQRRGLIRNCTISRNRGGWAGGIRGTRARISGCMVEDNISSRGAGGIETHYDTVGGWYLYHWSTVVQECVIRGNESESGFGGVTAYIIQNCLITQNKSIGAAANVVQNCTIVANPGGGVRCRRGLVTNSIVWGNTGDDPAQRQIETTEQSVVERCFVQEWTGPNGKYVWSDNPGFVNAGAGDYRLRADSPCIDKGAAELNYEWREARDAGGNSRWEGSNVDIGCFEYGSSKDSDGDYLSDAMELTKNCNALTTDTDRDGLMDGLEVRRGTEPAKTTARAGIWTGDHGGIGRSLMLALPGETVWVRPGVHYENLRIWHARGKVLSGTDPDNPARVAETIIDGSFRMPAITAYPDNGTTLTIRGLTIQGGVVEPNNPHDKRIIPDHLSGTAIRQVERNGYCVIEKNVFKNNAQGVLGTIQGDVRGNVFTANGGSYLVHSCNGTFESNLVRFNNCDYVLIKDPERVINCVFVNNRSCMVNHPYNTEAGGVVEFEGIDNIIANCTIVNNDSGVARAAGVRAFRGKIRNCIVWGNVSLGGHQVLGVGSTAPDVQYSLVQGWTYGGLGMLYEDPLFVSAAAGNYEVRRGSPAIDAGTRIDGLAADLLGRPRPIDGDRGGAGRTGDGSDYDIGAYEFPTPENAAEAWERYR